MAEMVINSNNNWELNDTSQNIIYVKTLKTSDNFVDRDIEVKITAKDGAVAINDKIITITPTIEYVNSTDSYSINITGNTTVIPVVTEGWVSTGKSGTVYVNGSLNVNATKMSSSLVPDATQTSGYSVYRTTASKGYNAAALDSDINVYQGDYQ